jgi:hypothetical protein
MLLEKLDALKESILEQIQNMLMVEVVKAGIAWIIGLLNPAAAFIKACKAIYEIVMFFVNNGRRILEFVSAVLDSLGAIARGQLDEAANKVEDALARTIPLIIGFLAALLNLGDIGEKVKKIIARIQAPVNKAIDWVIDKAVAGGKALFAAGKKAVKGLFGWGSAKAGFKDSEGHAHSVYVDVAQGKPRLTIKSDPQTALAFVNGYAAHAGLPSNDKKLLAAIAAINAAQTKSTEIATAENGGATEAQLAPQFQQLLDLNVAVSNEIRLLIIDKNVSALQNDSVHQLEGTTGTFGSMPRATGDKLTPDHQPQKALFLAAKEIEGKAADNCFPAGSKLADLAQGGVPAGYAINVYNERHYKGRTYGDSSLVATFKSGLTAPAFRAKPRKERAADIVTYLKAELDQDVAKMKAVYNPAIPDHFPDIVPKGVQPSTPQQDLINDICRRVQKGEDEIKNQNMDRLNDCK